jgi:molecular chaperone GrpE
VSDSFEHQGPAPDLGGDPAGGPFGQRPAASRSEPDAEPSPEARSEVVDDETSPGDESDGASDESLPGDVDQTAGVDPLSEALAERDDYRDALVRLQADFENYKKRMLKQQTEYLERAASQLVDKLLPVLDAADLAMAHGGGEDIKQVTGALVSALEKEGLERIAGEGSPFDPTLHDAVMHEPAEEGGEQTVTEVLRAGYKWKGRVLRPAMVKVRG